MNGGKSPADKRQSERIPVDLEGIADFVQPSAVRSSLEDTPIGGLPADASASTRERSWVPCRVSNISLHGALITIGDIPREDYARLVSKRRTREISLSFALPDRNTPVRVHGRICWAVHHDAPANLCNLGVEYARMSDVDRDRVVDFISTLLQNRG